MKIAHILCNITDILNRDIKSSRLKLYRAIQETLHFTSSVRMNTIRHMINDVTLELYVWDGLDFSHQENQVKMSHYRGSIFKTTHIETLWLSSFEYLIAYAVESAVTASRFHPEIYMLFGPGKTPGMEIPKLCAVTEPKKVTLYVGDKCFLAAQERFRRLTYRLKSPKNEHFCIGTEPCEFIDTILDSNLQVQPTDCPAI